MFQRQMNLENIDVPKSILIDDIEFKIKVIFSDKKNSSAGIKNGVIEFRFSKRIDRTTFDKHFENLLERIKKQIQKNPQNFLNNDKNKIKQIIQDGHFYFNNELFKIKFHNFKYAKITRENEIYLNPNQSSETYKYLIEKLLAKHFLEWIETYIIKINKETFNYKIGKISLKCVGSKWGHCTSNNNIMINLKLLNGKKELLDYVIIHELSHVEHKNHGEKFWKNVERFCKNYKQLRKQLRENPPKIFK
jgi:predicted metal-dependent hydrolase